MPNMNNLRNRFRLRGARSNSTQNNNHTTTTTTDNGSDHRTSSLTPHASDSTAVSYAWTQDAGHHSIHSSQSRRVRQLGCHKACCGGFCLRIGTQACCVHAPIDADDAQDDESPRACSFCCDRRREQRRLEQQQQQDALTATSGSSDDEELEESGIPKACCGCLCNGPSYTHCCEHGDLNSSGLYAGRHSPGYESYCNLCRDRCRRRSRDMQQDNDNSSVGAVRLMPTPAGRRSTPPPPTPQETPKDSMAEQLATVGEDSALERCVTKCLASIECPVCLEPFGDDPCTLPCGHSVCLTHIANLDKCPCCRWPLARHWKTYCQPSIVLRESSAAVKEAVTLLMDMEARMDHQLQQQQQQQESKEEHNVSVIGRPPCHHQWSPPEAQKVVVVDRMSLSSATSTTSDSCSEEDSPLPNTASCTKSKTPSIGISVDC